MKPQNIIVQSGDKRVLSFDDPGDLEPNFLALQPKTTVALKAIVGMPGYLHHLNAEDTDNFTVLKPRDCSTLLQIGGKRCSEEEDTRVPLFRGLVSRLHDHTPIPSRLRIASGIRPLGGVSALSGSAGIGSIPDNEMVDVDVPEWMRDLQIFSPVLVSNDVVIHDFAELLFDESLSHHQMMNFTLHKQSHLIIRANHTVINIIGNLTFL